MRVEHPATGCQLRVTDIDGRRVTAFVTGNAGQPQVLDLRNRSRGRCEQRIKDAKDLGFLAVPHYSYAANRVWMHAVMLAGMLNSWAGLLGADPGELAAAKKTACDVRRNGYPSTSEQAKATRKAARSCGGCGIRARCGPGCCPPLPRWLGTPGGCGCISTVMPLTRVCWPRRWQGSGDWTSRCSPALVAVFFMLVVLCPYSMKNRGPQSPRTWIIRPASRHAWGRINTVSAVRGPLNWRNHAP